MNSETIIEIISDEYSRKILSATANKELSALQLSVQLDIPQATVYRKVRCLKDVGLLKPIKSVIIHGNEEIFYRSTIKKAVIIFERGKLTARLELNEVESFVRLWKVFTDKNIKATKK
ncbi:MAG TPA: ArsR family transcriptional regulator [Euryarchaeota archaeon]|nr:hypothetical protein BMS3Bbin15_00131 [archaeon BMS3Bbin15]HDL14887.1 ArsR family transcriptional regulator [Euryarchaeota archaeon]